MDSLQALIEGKDQRYRNGLLIPITNPITGESKVYFEKRPGLEQADAIADCTGNAIFFSRAFNVIVTAFCETDVYVDGEEAGTVTGETLDNSGFAIFACGNQSGGFASRGAQKYVYSTDAESLSADDMSVNTGNLAAAGNYEFGIYAGGSTGATTKADTCKYTYSTDTPTAATALTEIRQLHAAAGNATRGIFACGLVGVGSPVESTTEKYTYSTDGVATATSLAIERFRLAGVGNGELGIFGHGNKADDSTPTATDKYTYATDAATSGTDLSYGTLQSKACGSTTKGFFAGGNITGSISTVISYEYATNTVSSATALTIARRDHAAASNHTFGIFMGGLEEGQVTIPMDSTDKYDLTTETSTTGTTMVFTQYDHAGTSSSPGHL